MFRRRGLSRVRSAINRSTPVNMFLRDSCGRFSSSFVSLVPTGVSGRGENLMIIGTATTGRKTISVPGTAINWESVALTS